MERAEVRKALKIRFADRALPEGGREEGREGEREREMGLTEPSKDTAEHWLWVLGGSTAQAVGTSVPHGQVELAPKKNSAGAGHAGPFQRSAQRQKH